MFQGYDPAVEEFLWGLRFNNDRSWFEPRKETYKTLLEGPTRELCKELYDGMAAAHRDLPLMSKVSRIYRDARRLHGRGPYKDHLWLTVAAPAQQWEDRPSFWFEIEPEGYSFGLGYWTAEAVTMAKLRHRLDVRPGEFERLVAPLERDARLELRGESYKKRRTAPSQRLEPYYNMRHGFSFSCRRPYDELLASPQLVPAILEQWEAMVPLFCYLTTLEGDPDPREG